MSEFPRMLFRDGDEIDVNGALVDTLIVGDGEEMADALDAGWRTELIAAERHPLDNDGDGRPGGSPSKRRGRPPNDPFQS